MATDAAPQDEQALRAIGERLRAEVAPAPPAHDLQRLGAWTLMAAVALILGAMGAASWHARMVFPWLAGLGLATALAVAALDLPRHLAGAVRDAAEE